MSNISSVSSSSSYSDYQQQQQISASTKRQLEALGIDSSAVTSESQAQSLIQAKQSEVKFQDALSSTQSTEQDSTSQDSTSETEVLSQAKLLAEELGVSVSSDDTFEDITSAISDAIQKLMDKSANDPQALQRAQSYMTQLSQLTSQYTSATNSTNSVYAAMNNQAANNKYMLGL
jgi:DNA repair ATPase RecN